MEYKECIVIAELGCNHQGNMDLAKEMIKQAKLAGAHYCKFQKRDINNYPKEWNDIYNSENSFGKTYIDHRRFLEFNIEQHKELKRYCEDYIGIGYSCSVWDIQSAKEIIPLILDYIKIPSACNNNYKLLEYVYSNYNEFIHISLGMATREERQSLLFWLETSEHKYEDKTIPYWTTSDYPVKFEELYLMEIFSLAFNGYEVGFSGHHLGIAADIAAYTLGASYIERHFTLDRTMKGTDQSASLEPSGLQKLCRDLKAVHKSLSYKGEGITKGEKKNREKLRDE